MIILVVLVVWLVYMKQWSQATIVTHTMHNSMHLHLTTAYLIDYLLYYSYIDNNCCF
jgi:hypothetical protein